MSTLSRAKRHAALAAAFESTAVVAGALGDVVVPVDITNWLSRLHRLVGVPFENLVPDERMLPPESIRFFRLDAAWTEALVDGAFSLGRNLSHDTPTPSTHVDRVVSPTLLAAVRAATPRRARFAVASAPDPTTSVNWSGFLLRSHVVTDFPGLGVNAYPAGASGDDPREALTLIRHDRLGAGSDTMLFLAEGDVAFYDIHEPPEHLHFGVDEYTPPSAPNSAPVVTKGIRAFTAVAGGVTTLAPSEKVRIDTVFRVSSPRVMKYTAMAAQLAAQSKRASIDAAQMGFEMTQGVGNVRFKRETP